MSKAVKYGIVAAVLFILIFGGQIVTLYTDWLWFREVGYTSVFSRVLWAKIAMALAGGALFFAFAGLNLWLARRAVPLQTVSYDVDFRFRQRAGILMRKGIGWLIALALLVASGFVALEAGSHWSQYLMFANATPFGVKDPVFGNDIGFYVFRLPFWNYLYYWSIVSVVLTGIGVASVYYADRAIDFIAGTPRLAPGVRRHLLTLVALLLALKAIGYRLGAYDLLFSTRGAAYGAMFTDVHARLPLMNLMMVAALVAAAVVIYSVNARGWRLPLMAIGGLLVLSILAGAGYPELVQQTRVKPNELEKERPYIARTIQFTRQAFGLDRISTQSFPASGTLSGADIVRNQATINNIRLWDYRPLSSTYQNLQAIRPYYSFGGEDYVGIDRYTVNGQYRQVMLSPRELIDTPQNSATWVMDRLQYTHGYGLVMSPTSEANSEGLPNFIISGIPMVNTTSVSVKQPRIYYGRLSDKYVVVNTDQPEFDYPQGKTEVSTRYTGVGGIPMGSMLRRALFATRLTDWNLVLSGAIRPDSRMMIRRTIGERMRTLAPFLVYDADPYMVVTDGRLKWVQDAYTVTSAYPYSEPHEMDGSLTPVNYARNSVKAIVDAYDGSVQFYVSDPTDPIIRTYARIFPGLFKDIQTISSDLRAHLRYPEALFGLQATVYETYHMTDPSVFYSKQDVWNFPKEGGQQRDQEKLPMQPYYVIMKLPGGESEEFMLILPFTPPGRPNMIAWMAAKCDPQDYGRLTVYQFPDLAYGPEQIDARINQDTTISGEVTLWNQSGSQVIYGNLLVIPIEDSLLYVEPLYLQSTQGKMPELKRVIVAYKDRVVMATTLGEALGEIFGAQAASVAPATAPAASSTGTPVAAASGVAPSAPSGPVMTPALRQLVVQANQSYQRAMDAQRRGDWTAYGKEQKQLESILKQMQGKAR